jgi:C1A family cysteine protease
MLIIGYDDEMESAGGSKGAVLLQNSWGEGWGMSWADAFKRQYPQLPVKQTRGYAWITYEVFRALGKRVFSIQV